MPRGYRCIFIAAVGWLTLGNSQPQQPFNQLVNSATAKITKPTPAPIASEPLKSVYPSKYNTPCREQQSHDGCDLEAQWKAADAARDAANWGWWQMVFSGFGLAGLLYSLVLTRRATKVAIDATQDADNALRLAQRNADALERQVSLMEGTARKQLRPYLYIASVKPIFESMHGIGYLADQAEFALVVRNYGQTPAKKVVLFVKANVGGYWSDRPQADLGSDLGIEFADMPQGSKVRQDGIFVHGLVAANDHILDGTASIFIEGQIQYADDLGATYVTYFQRALTGEDFESDTPVTTPHWNTAT